MSGPRDSDIRRYVRDLVGGFISGTVPWATFHAELGRWWPAAAERLDYESMGWLEHMWDMTAEATPRIDALPADARAGAIMNLRSALKYPWGNIPDWGVPWD